MIHGDSATALMILGLVTFAKVKPHPPTSIMTCLIFVLEVGKVGGGMWL